MKASTIILMAGVIILSIGETFGGIRWNMWQYWGIFIGWWLVYTAGVFSGKGQ